MIADNLLSLRKLHGLTQEDVAERIGVSRQAVAKWESGETLPDIQRCCLLAKLYGVSVDALAGIEDGPKQSAPAPKGKHIFGIVTMGERGQLVIPQKAREIFQLRPGERLVVLGDENQGLALIKERGLLDMMNFLRHIEGEGE